MTVRKGGSGLKPMIWLLRYAKYCKVSMDGGRPPEIQLRERFGAPAWRLLCRSDRHAFVPILRARDLTFEDLIDFCQRLAVNGFIQAPPGHMLAYFVDQRRRYFDERSEVPSAAQMAIMRVASKAGCTSQRELSLVAIWLDDADVMGRREWKTLVRQASVASQAQFPHSRRRRVAPWHFFCGEVVWRGYEIHPLADLDSLWLEGAAMRSCLYKLRHLCLSEEPSRFFSVRRGGKRLATLELSLSAPSPVAIAMAGIADGRWSMRDLRLSCNRLPDPSLQASMRDFAQMYDRWSLRPSRWPAASAERAHNTNNRMGLREPVASAPETFRFWIGPARSSERREPGADAPGLQQEALLQQG